MSDTQAYEEVTVSAEGVTVLKRFEAEEFPVPAIAFEFVSRREEPVTVRLEDEVPDSVAVEDLGFHPEYGSEFWTIEDETITFEKELAAETTYTTVYGIRATGTDDIERFLTEPTIEQVDPPLPEGESVDGDGATPEAASAVREAIATDGEVPGLDDEEEDEEDEEEIETIELNDPTAAENADSGSDPGPPVDSDPGLDDGTTVGAEGPELDADLGTDADGSGDLEPEAGSDGEPAGGEGVDTAGTSGAESLVTALAEELQENEVSGEDVERLREALAPADEERGSVDARLDRIQGDIADLRAYTDALEEFLDENGTGEQLIEDARRQIDQFEETIAEVGKRAETAEETAQTADEKAEEIREEIEDVSGEVGEVDEEVDRVRREVKGIGEDVDTVEGAVEDLESEIEAFEDELDGIRGTMATEEALDRIDDLESEIRELRDWQEQIQQTFGG